MSDHHAALGTVAADGAVHLPVHLKRRHQGRFVSGLLQDVPAVFTVVAAGASALRSGREGGGLALAAAEIIVGALVLASIAVEARHLFGRNAAHHAPASPDEARLDYPSLAAAALGYVEVWHHAHESGHFKIVSPYMLGATASLLVGVGGRRLIARRMAHRRRYRLVIGAEGVSYRGSRRRRWSAPWSEIAEIGGGDEELIFHLRDGRRHVMRARDHFGGGALVAAAKEAVAAHAPATLTHHSHSPA